MKAETFPNQPIKGQQTLANQVRANRNDILSKVGTDFKCDRTTSNWDNRSTFDDRFANG